jgi:hypothetical protein
MFIGVPPPENVPAVSKTIWPLAVPTPQCVGGPAEVVYGPVLLATVIRVPLWENKIARRPRVGLRVSQHNRQGAGSGGDRGGGTAGLAAARSRSYPAGL